MSDALRAVLVCGDRNWSNRSRIRSVLERAVQKYGRFLVVHGDCEGADRLAGAVAEELGLPVDKNPAAWSVHEDCRCSAGARTCRAAGPRRNQRMLDKHGSRIFMVLAFHDSLASSKGTKDMARRSLKAGLSTFQVGSTFARTLSLPL